MVRVRVGMVVMAVIMRMAVGVLMRVIVRVAILMRMPVIVMVIVVVMMAVAGADAFHVVVVAFLAETHFVFKA